MTTVKQKIINANAAHRDWTAQEVADFVGTTVSYAHAVALECGLTFHRRRVNVTRTSAQADQVQRLNEANPHWTVAQVAKHLGDTQTFVRNVGYQRGLKFGSHKQSEADKRRHARTDAFNEAREAVREMGLTHALTNKVIEAINAKEQVNG